MIRWKSHLIIALVAAAVLATPEVSSATSFKMPVGQGKMSNLIVGVQYQDSERSAGDFVNQNDRTNSTRRGQLRARRKSESWVRIGSRRFRARIRECVAVAKRTATDGRDCFATALDKYADWIERPKTVLQEKPRIVRTIRQAAAATSRAPSNRAASAAVKRAAEQVQASVQLITLADDSLVVAETRSVDVIANDLEVASAALLTIQGVWFMDELLVQTA